jgi:phenylalanyl-tRNA synthetase beta chain
VKFVDEYMGKQVPEGKKSVTIRLVIGSGEKTLTGAEIETVANSVIKKLTKVLGADIRSK